VVLRPTPAIAGSELFLGDNHDPVPRGWVSEYLLGGVVFAALALGLRYCLDQVHRPAEHECSAHPPA